MWQPYAIQLCLPINKRSATASALGLKNSWLPPSAQSRPHVERRSGNRVEKKISSHTRCEIQVDQADVAFQTGVEFLLIGRGCESVTTNTNARDTKVHTNEPLESYNFNFIIRQ
jgi:hypothetical protein